MCRVACFPPGFTKKKALKIMANFYLGNDDGTGSVYVKDGKFIVNKWNISFEEVLKKKLPLFDHMPYNGWTLAHVRAASHGKNTINNTHPFIKGDTAMVHNGIFQEYEPVKAALSATHTFKGQTDSEVAHALYQVAGKQKFTQAIESGVFMFLNRQGRVNVICKSGGDLVFQKTKQGVVMASELPDSYRRKQTVMEGVFTLGKNGLIIYSNWEKDIAVNYARGWNYEEYLPKKHNWKKKKGAIKIGDGFDHYPDEDDLAEFREAKGSRGYIWYN
jgi:predicted glutamine amidotransferase